MENEQCYLISKSKQAKNVVCLDFGKLDDGFHITPKNQLQYDGITVQQLVIIKQSLIEKLLKRKIKKKLELYLNYIVDIIDDDDDTDAGSLNEILGELSRFRDVLRYRYQKYLGEEYIELMLKKMELLEYELKLKTMRYKEPVMFMEEEMTNTRTR